MKHEFDLEAGTREFYVDTLYYDHEFEKRTADARWYCDRYLEAEGTILELGVGTGRIALKAVRKGASVIGLDTAHSMLSRAAERRAKLPQSRRDDLQLIQGDMREFALSKRFELITCPFNAFQHLYTLDDIARCLDRVRTHLTPDGLFIFDVLVPDLEYLNRSPLKRYPGVTFRHPTFGVSYTYSEQTAYDPIKQLNQMWLHYDRSEPDSAAPEHFCIELSHRVFFPQEIFGILKHNGFTVLQCLGDFDGGPLSAESESMVFLCGV